MLLKSKKLIFVAILASLVGSIGAQTTSPYSRYGYGVLKDQSVGLSKGMGGIGYGLRNSQSANPLNPASYSRVDSLTFLFDIGIYGNKAKLSDGSNSQSDDNGGLEYITMLMPLSKQLGLSFGVLPFSSVGYSFGETGTVDDSNVGFMKSYSGTGGFSQLYVGLGYDTPIKGLSVGANASYLFGTIDHEKSLPYVGGASSYTSAEYEELHLSSFKLDFGLQYEMQLSKRNLLTIGAAFTPAMKSTAKYERIYHDYDVSSSSTGKPAYGDTISVSGADAGIPMSVGAGFTFMRDEKLLFGADVTYQKWSEVDYSDRMGDGLNKSNRFNDRWKINVGGEYMIDPYGRNYLQKVKFRGGLNYSNSYMNVKSESGEVGGYDEYGATIGFGLPFLDRDGGNRTSYVNINFEYKKMNPKISGLIKEDYFGISIGVNINELWFFRRKVQ